MHAGERCAASVSATVGREAARGARLVPGRGVLLRARELLGIGNLVLDVLANISRYVTILMIGLGLTCCRTQKSAIKY